MSERHNMLHDTRSQTDEAGIVQRWIDTQLGRAGFRSDRISKTELTEHSQRFLALLRQSLGSGSADMQSPAWANTRQMLEELSASRAQQGFSPSETALFIFSLKETLFEALQHAAGEGSRRPRPRAHRTPTSCSTGWASTRPRSISAAARR